MKNILQALILVPVTPAITGTKISACKIFFICIPFRKNMLVK
jgi:hypothetical protein